MRKDAECNRRRLIDAAEVVLLESPKSITVVSIAEAAGLSSATAYRYFPTLEDLLDTFLREIVIRLRDYSHECSGRGLKLYEDVVHEWIRLVGIHGRGMVQARSRRGYPTRLHEHDPVISAVRDAWERPVRAIMRLEGVAEDHFEYGVFLHNLLFDPREIIDLMASGMNEPEIKSRLILAYRGAIRGWARTG